MESSHDRDEEAVRQLQEKLAQAEQDLSRLHGIQQVTDAALARLPLDELLLVILDRARLLLSGDTAAILLLDERTNELLVRAARGLEDGVERGIRIPLGGGFAGRIATERRPVVLHDVDYSKVLNPVLRENGVRSLVGVPLLVEGTLLGVLHVGTLRQRPFSQDEVEVLETAAERVALALDRAQALEGEQRAHARLAALLHDLSRAEDESLRLRRLQQITEAALTQLSLDELTQELLERLQFLLGVDTAVIFLRDRERLVLHAARGLDERPGFEIPLGQGFAGTIAASGEPLVVEDVEAGGVALVSPALRERHLRSLVGVPLVFESEVTGVLHVGSSAPRAFGVAEVELLQATAGRIALAIARAAAYQAEQAARAELEAERARLAAILRGLEAVVWESDDPGRRRFGFVSGRAEELLGYPLGRWQEEGFWASLVVPAEREAVELYFREGAARGEPHELEYCMRASDGRLVRVREIVRPQEGVLRGLLVDVTARHELQRQLLQAQKMEAVGQLAGGIAHDFNNLLTVITGFARVLEKRVGEDEQAVGHLGEIRSAAARAAELTSQLLTFSRKAPQPGEVVEPNAVVEGVRTMLERLIDEDIRLELRIGEQLSPVRIERGQLEQVLVNLVVNARDAIVPRSGAIRIETSALMLEDERAARHGLERGEYSVLVVSDTGSGMDDHTKARIFEPFYTTKAAGRGTGLGLATVYGIIDAAGGRIEVESELGRGSDFVIYLPAAKHDESAAASALAAEQPPTILLVEDEQALRGLARLVLEEDGYCVLEARNGREALELAERAARIDLVLTDVVMPELGGPELVSRLSERRGSETKVIYMSGYVDSRLAQRGLAEHALLLRKPFEPEQLQQLVRELLD